MEAVRARFREPVSRRASKLAGLPHPSRLSKGGGNHGPERSSVLGEQAFPSRARKCQRISPALAAEGLLPAAIRRTSPTSLSFETPRAENRTQKAESWKGFLPKTLIQTI